ncbi:MAG: hypothetical protein K8J31_18800 [Anaerolineae bacterium]|nr:hypothetical protein [Anaerolineae bacterium]
MASSYTTPTMDVLPWPNGHGFQGTTAWWDYVNSKEERKRLDNLMGLALLDSDICRRLLKDRDASLLAAFELSPATQACLRSIQAATLTEFAEAIMAGPQGQYLEEAS